jgi:FMN phosphatase YigB (HAD superfamily)
MINNIVFDLGNVLISFKPDEYLKKISYPEEISKIILKDIFCSNEWQMLDEGSISITEAITSIALKSFLKRDEIIQIFNLRREIFTPLEKNVRIIPKLKEMGFRLYYLSNFPSDMFYKVKADNSFFGYFDGGIISSEVRLLKPDVRIFNLLVKKLSLNPQDCLFIDDIKENILTAESIGMQGFHTSGSQDIAKDVFRKLGISNFKNI